MRTGKAESVASANRLRLGRLVTLACICVQTLIVPRIFAGGSALNTLVVVNTNSPNSLELGNYYCERRGVPPDNVLRIGWTGNTSAWQASDYQTNLFQPLVQMVNARGLVTQALFVVLSMDIPYQTINGTIYNSTTACLFYGVKPDPGNDFRGTTNSYASGDAMFEQAKPGSAPGYSFLATMITGSTLAQAKQIVDQGVKGDASYPLRPVLLAKTSDRLRNIRYAAFDNAMFNIRIRGNYVVARTNVDSCWGFSGLLGYQTGLSYMSFSPNTFLPGSIADTMTSYAGLIIGQPESASLLAFINAGAAGSYGTVMEPGADTQKFPDPQDYFYQARGFSLAESYYQVLNAPYLGLIVGEPLSAPFLRKATGGWNLPPTNAIVSGILPLSIKFIAPDKDHPLSQIDLFLDGKFSQVLTNLPPQPGNVVSVSLNGIPASYTVPGGATLPSICSGLTAQLNSPAISNVTKVAAFARGDRIELRSVATNRTAEVSYFSDPLLTTGGRYYRLHYLAVDIPPSLTSTGRDPSGAYRLQCQSPAGTPLLIEASTDLATWAPVATNTAGGLYDFLDASAATLPRRFYRLNHPMPDFRPLLSLNATTSVANVHVDSQTSFPYLIQTSTNMIDWTPFATNSFGGALDLTNAFSDSPSRFFRAQVLTPAAPKITVINPTTFQVANASQPYVIELSTNLLSWNVVLTNWNPGAVTVSTTSSAGSAASVSAFISTPRDALLESEALGYRVYNVNGIYNAGAWLQLAVTRLSGATVLVGATNDGSLATLADLASKLTNAVNTCPDLQGPDGVVVDEIGQNVYGGPALTVRARTGGYNASKVQGRLLASSRLVPNPGATQGLNYNLADLQPRNHLYLTCGAREISSAFNLDTTTLADGYHELAAVAYEGSHVRCQTRLILPITVKNTAWKSALTLVDLAPTNSVSGTYHIQLSSTAPNVTALRLFSNGGQVGAVSNQPNATFTVNGNLLGAGLIPFYGIVETGAGQSLRTPPQTVRFISP